MWCQHLCGEVDLRQSLGTTYEVPHVCSTHKKGADVVSPLDLASYRTIIRHVGTIIDEVITCEQRCANNPVVGLVGPIRVSLITGISSKASGQLEKASIRYTILVLIPVVPSEDLPSKPPSTCGGIPSAGLFVEYCLSKREP